MEKQTYTETVNTRTYEGDLILETDLRISKNLIVKGRILGKDSKRYNIDAWSINAWSINAWNINAWNIDAENIDAWNIDAENINAWNIDAENIDAWNIDAWSIHAWNIDAENIDAENIDAGNIIFCDKIKVKKGCKIRCKVLIKDRFNLEKKEKRNDNN